MTAANFCASGEAEGVKGSVHAVAGTIVGLMAVYNAVAWWYRRERHLGVNVMIYAAGFAFETYQTSRHFRRVGAPALAAVTSRTPAPPETCECGDGFCWCGSAESRAGAFAAMPF